MAQTQSADKKVAEQTEGSGRKRILQGVVVSDKMEKTIVVKVDRRVKHGQYLKYLTLSKKYKAHDEKREAKTGDRVEIVESRPISRHKCWALRRVLERSSLQ
ncbi:MAG: 30S ribosomal protein S17 [Deltaproteobacteria bacterium]|nr:30S ribosomal protein S17 [Deltaproteobacteria bacterium]